MKILFTFLDFAFLHHIPTMMKAKGPSDLQKKTKNEIEIGPSKLFCRIVLLILVIDVAPSSF